jgi:uncharacterized protein DUF5318
VRGRDHQRDVSSRCIDLIHRNDTCYVDAVQGGAIVRCLEILVTPPRDEPRTGQVCSPGQFRRNLSGMRRSVVDYGLARRATLASVLSGRTTVTDVCDAHPYLLRAAKFHGEPTETKCPICRNAKLTHVTYVYGDELGRYEGRVKRGPELDEMAMEYGEFQVYVVEVCQSCAWNHLASSYVLGTGEPAPRRSRRARAGE